MKGKDTDEGSVLKAFSSRLNLLAEEAGLPANKRQSLLSRRMGVSQKGARRWLMAEGFPLIPKAVELAVEFDVTFEWLMTGRGPKHHPVSGEDQYALFWMVFNSLPDETKRKIVQYAAFLLDKNSKEQMQLIKLGEEHEFDLGNGGGV